MLLLDARRAVVPGEQHEEREGDRRAAGEVPGRPSWASWGRSPRDWRRPTSGRGAADVVPRRLAVNMGASPAVAPSLLETFGGIKVGVFGVADPALRQASGRRGAGSGRGGAARGRAAARRGRRAGRGAGPGRQAAGASGGARGGARSGRSGAAGPARAAARGTRRQRVRGHACRRAAAGRPHRRRVARPRDRWSTPVGRRRRRSGASRSTRPSRGSTSSSPRGAKDGGDAAFIASKRARARGAARRAQGDWTRRGRRPRREATSRTG